MSSQAAQVDRHSTTLYAVAVAVLALIEANLQHGSLNWRKISIALKMREAGSLREMWLRKLPEPPLSAIAGVSWMMLFGRPVFIGGSVLGVAGSVGRSAARQNTGWRQWRRNRGSQG